MTDNTLAAINEERLPFREARDCTVVAAALTTGKGYKAAWSAYDSAGRTPRRGTILPVQEEAYRRLGFTLKPVKVKAKTVLTLPRELPEGRYHVRIKRHALALMDGKILDFTAGRRHRIMSVHRVVGQPTTQIDLFG